MLKMLDVFFFNSRKQSIPISISYKETGKRNKNHVCWKEKISIPEYKWQI